MSEIVMEIDDALFFKNCVAACKSILEETPLEISPTGLHIRAMDSAGLAMCDFELNKKYFSRYDVNETALISVDLNVLDKYLSRARTEDKLKISFIDKRKMTVEFKGNMKRTFETALLASEKEITMLMKEPNVNYTNSLEIKAKIFKEILSDCSTLETNHIKPELSPESICFKADGKFGNLDVELEKNSEFLGKMSVKDKVENTYFLIKYLKDICSSCPDEEKITLSLNTDTPIKIVYALSNAKLLYYLAPRMLSPGEKL